jgi:hypothetical protein
LPYYEDHFTDVTSTLPLNNGDHWICISIGLSLLVVALGLGCTAIVVCGASAVDWLTGRLVFTANWTLTGTDDFFNVAVNEIRLVTLQNAFKTKVTPQYAYDFSGIIPRFGQLTVTELLNSIARTPVIRFVAEFLYNL